MTLTTTFNYTQILKAEFISQNGAVEYIHSSKNESGTAFSNDENIKLRFALPRSLGTTYARLVLLSEYENEEVASFDLLWDFCDLGYDFYIADIKRSLGKGLYFFYLEISSENLHICKG